MVEVICKFGHEVFPNEVTENATNHFSTSSPGRFSLALEVGRENALASAGQSVILID